MIVHVYSVCYNEKDMLPYYLRYYENVADKMIIFDNQSTDGSTEMLKAHPKVQACSFKTDGVNDEVMTGIYNEAYKTMSQDADWIIIVDIDEIIVSAKARLRDVLQEMLDNDVIIPHVAGYQMVAEKFVKSDKQIWEVVKRGVRDPVYDKFAVFRPEVNINYIPGRHRALPECNRYMTSSFDVLALLHYKFFGRERYLNRQEMLCKRISKVNKKNKYGLFHKDRDKANDFFSYTLSAAGEVLG